MPNETTILANGHTALLEISMEAEQEYYRVKPTGTMHPLK